MIKVKDERHEGSFAGRHFDRDVIILCAGSPSDESGPCGTRNTSGMAMTGSDTYPYRRIKEAVRASK